MGLGLLMQPAFRQNSIMAYEWLEEFSGSEIKLPHRIQPACCSVVGCRRSYSCKNIEDPFRIATLQQASATSSVNDTYSHSIPAHLTIY